MATMICRWADVCNQDCPHRENHDVCPNNAPCNLIDASNKCVNACIPVTEYNKIRSAQNPIRYQLLNVGDIIQDGDEEYAIENYGKWTSVTAESINEPIQKMDFPIRRPLPTDYHSKEPL
jgi:hypothetical protein